MELPAKGGTSAIAGREDVLWKGVAAPLLRKLWALALIEQAMSPTAPRESWPSPRNAVVEAVVSLGDSPSLPSASPVLNLRIPSRSAATTPSSASPVLRRLCRTAARPAASIPFATDPLTLSAKCECLWTASDPTGSLDQGTSRFVPSAAPTAKTIRTLERTDEVGSPAPKPMGLPVPWQTL